LRRTTLELSDRETGAIFAGVKFLRRHRRLGQGAFVLFIYPGLDFIRRFREGRALALDKNRGKKLLIIDEVRRGPYRDCLILYPKRKIESLRDILRRALVDKKGVIVRLSKDPSGAPEGAQYQSCGLSSLPRDVY